jgi:LuxR family maltose regulon positive regulatory protein
VVAPLLEIKTRMPDRRPGAVPRPRLVERVARPTRLTLVSAPAGFGKTTLLTQALAGVRPLAWVSLDERDDEPVAFWTYVLTAVHAEVALGLLPSVDAALAAWLNDLGAEPLTLVVDDYHLVASEEIHDGMAFLLDHLPPNVHLVIATRADPPLPLSRLRARGELVEVRAADLRFTDDEAAEYLAGTMGLALTAADVGALAERTEGWAAALQLAGLSLQGRADPGAVVARFAGDDRFIVDYLADEVLARLPADVHDFLLRTSVLTRLTDRCATPSRGRAAAPRGSSPSTGPTSSSSRSTTSAAGTATTTSSPTSCARTWTRARPRRCTAAPATGCTPTGTPSKPSTTPWRPRTSPAPRT